MHKLLIFAPYFYPEQIASSHLDKNLNEAYNNASFRRVLYVPLPCRGITNSIKEEYKRIRYEERSGGLEVIHRFWMFYEGRNSFQRAFRYLLCSIVQLWKGCFAKDVKDCNIITAGSTPPILGVVAAIVKKKRHIPMLYILQDIFPDSLVGAGMAKRGGVLWKIGRWLEDFTYRNSDKIIVISQDFKYNIMAKGVPKEKIEVVYNWIDTRNIVPVNRDFNPLFTEFNISKESFNVVYAGNLGSAQNVMLLIEAAIALKGENDINIVIFGTGGKEKEIRQAVRDNNLTNVKLLPLQPVESVSKVYSLGDVCVVACMPGFGGSAMPSKTWSIMACSRPVLASFDEGELKAIIEDNNCGVYTKAGDVIGFTQAIKNLRDNTDTCEKMGENGRKFVMNNLTKEIGTQKYVDIIRSLVNTVRS